MRLLLAVIAALSLTACASSPRIYGVDDWAVGWTVHDSEGLKVVLQNEPSSPDYCPGFIGAWQGNDFHFNAVRAKRGTNPVVTHPAVTTATGWRYVVIPHDHVPPGQMACLILHGTSGSRMLGGVGGAAQQALAADAAPRRR